MLLPILYCTVFIVTNVYTQHSTGWMKAITALIFEILLPDSKL